MLELALSLLETSKKSPQPLWLIMGSAQEARTLHRLLEAMGKISLDTLPSLETLPYEALEPHPDIRAKRLSTLHRWLDGQGAQCLITSIPAILSYLPPPAFVLGHCFCLETGQTLNLKTFKSHLIQSGYLMVDQVEKAGEFAHRGGTIDLFALGHKCPIRIEWFDDDIESLHRLHPKTLAMAQRLERIEYFPACEYHLENNQDKALLEQKWQQHLGGNPDSILTYQRLISGAKVPIADYFLPCLHETVATVFDYCHKGLCYYSDSVTQAAQDYFTLCQERYDALHTQTHPLLSPNTVFLTPDVLQTKLNQAQAKCLKPVASHKLPDVAGSLRHKDPFNKLKYYRSQHPQTRIIISLPSTTERDRMLELLAEQGLQACAIDQWHEAFSGKPKLYAWVSPLQQGLLLEQDKLCLITQNDLLPATTQVESTKSHEPHWDFDALQIGDYVVHRKHGIAQFQGIEHLHDQDFLTLHFAGDDRLYVPMHDLAAITLYGPTHSGTPPIHTLRSKRWAEKRLKALQKIQDTATELLQRRAKRALHKRPPYRFDTASYQAFCDEFPFQATKDQVRVSEEIMHDLEQDKPMDRLVCGDVGFGKTEIMMRTACIAALSGRPVAVLVPTTILAKQHYESFHQRFAHWPVGLYSLVGHSKALEQKKLTDAMQAGQVDILIGTHALLTKALPSGYFKMVIVDEEHRFGVKQKEAIRRNTTHQDVLMLSATPIPRSLNMALSSLKDISLLTTPPAKRIAVKTFVDTWSKALVKEAIERETLRGGQVFVCYNQVESIAAHCQLLQELFPHLSIDYAHGQMSHPQLKAVMQRFYQQDIQVLICTTIIESGIDQPNANTILVHRADRLGLAQLHQLRGRVGRSHHQAYAYFTYLDGQHITHDAKRRLKALEHHQAIGSGFQLSLQDLEIRGAGDLLGAQQSGHLNAIGLHLYTQTLQKAIAALEKDPNNTSLEALLELDQTLDIHHDFAANLPESYISDVHERLKWYQKLSECSDPDALFHYRKELIMHHGKLPIEAELLLHVQNMRFYATTCGMQSLSIREHTCSATLSEKAPLDTETLIEKVQSDPQHFQLKPPLTLILISPHTQRLKSMAWFTQSLQRLMQDERT